MRLLVLPKLYYLLIIHLNRWNGRKHFCSWLPCLGFFLWPKRTHLALGKPGAQNKGAFENKGKQHILSDPWKSIKTFLENKKKQRAKKGQKRLTDMQSLTKDFTFFKIRYTANTLI